MARPAPLESPITLRHSDFHCAAGIAAARGSLWTIKRYSTVVTTRIGYS